MGSINQSLLFISIALNAQSQAIGQDKKFALTSAVTTLLKTVAQIISFEIQFL